MSHKLDIVICTFNREEELKDCLTSLSDQKTMDQHWGLILVNNYPKPISQSVHEVLQKISDYKIYDLDIPGLSKARNLAIDKSDAEWIGFLDDDAVVSSGYIKKAIEIIDSSKFDCFGGHIRSRWKYGRPGWLSRQFGTKPLLRSQAGFIEDGYNWGSNLFIKRQALEKVGKFPEHIGLSGTHLGYAAENIVQIRLREEGYKIGYVPTFEIEHTVLPHKLKMSWHLRSAYATGRDGRVVFPEQYNFSGYLKSLKSCFSAPLISFENWIVKKEEHPAKIFLEFAKAVFLLAGKLVSLLK